MLKRLPFLLPILVFAVVAGYFVWGLNPERNPRIVPSAMIEKPLPEIDLPPVPGLEVPGLSTADLTGYDGVTLVNFFASWCIPCRAEHPLLNELAERGEVRIVGINYRDEPADAVAWLRELGNPYERIGADPNMRAGIDFGVSGVPETYVVDRRGVIRKQFIGPLDPNRLENELLPLIEELKS